MFNIVTLQNSKVNFKPLNCRLECEFSLEVEVKYCSIKEKRYFSVQVHHVETMVLYRTQLPISTL